jgi:thiol:disulfide interchange protein
MIQRYFARMTLFLMMTLCAAVPSLAQTGTNNILATLASESRTPASGANVMLAIDMKPKAGWHGYWKNPGEAGFSAQLKWTLPKGAVVGDIRYPVPERLVVSQLTNHVFNGEHALLVPLTLPANLAKDTVLPIALSGDWLACTDKICVPEHADLTLSLSVGDGNVAPADRMRFDGWRAKLPRPLGAQALFQVAGDTVRIGIPYPAGQSANAPWFFASTEDAIAYGQPQRVSRSGDMLIITAKASGPVKAQMLDGVLALGKDRGLEIKAVRGAVEAGGTDSNLRTIFLALGGAILGGLLLNIMPCVFPVISLKALSLARAGGDGRAARREALAYAAGVIATCMTLGGALLVLRAGGATVGWAFQLQEPRVILILLLLVTAITLNLAGTFELRSFGGGQALVDKGGTAGAFWTGALAAFVATPCTGPFMAAALGAAFVLPTVAALAIFAGLGLGLALPFLLLGFVPALRNRMPRPGAWMATFQRILSIPMFLTAAALVWLLWRQTGSSGLVVGLSGAIILAIVLMLVGRNQAGGKPVTLFLAVAALLSAGSILVLPKGDAQAHAALAGTEPFNEGRLANLRASGKPVFLYFTADWCLTCKVNEKAAIERAEVAAAFTAKGVVTMVGDWTNGDAAIGRFLEAQGRSGVPLYLYYRPGKADPEVLPQVLTPGTLLDILR